MLLLNPVASTSSSANLNGAEIPTLGGEAPIIPTELKPGRLRHENDPELTPRSAADWSVPAASSWKYPLVDIDTRKLLAHAAAKIKPLPKLPAGHPQSRRQPRWDGHAEHGYLEQACIIANSRYPYREEFIHCGDLGDFGCFACRDRLLCPRCSYKISAGIQERFKTAFASARLRGLQVYYLVLSVVRNQHVCRLSLDDELNMEGLKADGNCPTYVDQRIPFGAAEVFHTRQLFTFYPRAVKTIVASRKNRFIEGCFGGPELAVKFAPLGVIPHFNLVIFARPGFSREDLRKIRAEIKEILRNSRRFSSFTRRLGGLHPSVRGWRLNTQSDLDRVIRYMLKPISLSSAYADGCARSGRTPEGMHGLNSEVDTFLLNLDAAFGKLRRISFLGICHGGTANYIGITPSRRRKKRPQSRKSKMPKASDEESQWDDFLAERMDAEEIDRPPRLGAYRRWKLANHPAE